MSCSHCKNAVEKAIRGLPGILAAEVNLDAGKVTVEFDSAKTSRKEIEQAVEDQGYTIV